MKNLGCVRFFIIIIIECKYIHELYFVLTLNIMQTEDSKELYSVYSHNYVKTNDLLIAPKKLYRHWYDLIKNT